MLKEIELGCLYKIKDHKGDLVTIRASDYKHGLEHGFIHFADPTTGYIVGFCGVQYFKENAENMERYESKQSDRTWKRKT